MTEISELQQLMQETGLWRANHLPASLAKGIPTGFPELDPWLPDNGWPRESVTELLYPYSGIGELRLLAPALALLSQQQSRWIAWIGSPYIPYAPALIQAGIKIETILIIRPKSTADQLWAIEKSLASGACSAVLAWPEKSIQSKHIRRLQLACKAGQSWGLVFRSDKAAEQSSPAPLRLHLQPNRKSNLSKKSDICVSIIKRPGGWASGPIDIQFKGDLDLRRPHAPVTTIQKVSSQKVSSQKVSSQKVSSPRKFQYRQAATDTKAGLVWPDQTRPDQTRPDQTLVHPSLGNSFDRKQ